MSRQDSVFINLPYGSLA